MDNEGVAVKGSMCSLEYILYWETIIKYVKWLEA